MTLQVEIKPELEERLAARAQAHGKTLQAFILNLLEEEVARQQAGGCVVLTGKQKAAAFDSWVRSFPPNLPSLSLESISREKLYERD